MAKTNFIIEIVGKNNQAIKSIQQVSREISLLSQKAEFSSVAQKIISSFKNIGSAGVKVFSKLKDSIFSLKTLIASAFAGFTAKSFIDASNQIENALTGLQAIAKYQGLTFEEVNNAARELAEDGLMSIAEASQSLKNLLLRGFGLEESIQIINRLKDAAAFGRQAALSFGEAIVSATEGLKNENSILVDNAGVTKNVAKMWKDYADQIGKSVNDLTLAEKRQAEFLGIMQETEPMLGNAAKLTELWSGKTAKLGVVWAEIKAKIGDALKTALLPLMEEFLSWLQTLNDYISEHKEELTEFFSSLADSFLEFIKSISAKLPSLLGELSQIGDFFSSLQPVLSFVSDVVKGLIGSFQILVGVIRVFVADLSAGFKTLFYGLSLGGHVPVFKDALNFFKEQESLYREAGFSSIASGVEKLKEAFPGEEVKKEVKVEGLEQLNELLQKLNLIEDKDVKINVQVEEGSTGYGY